MRKVSFLSVTALLLLSACSKPQSDNKSAEKADADSRGIALSAEESESLGIITVPAGAATYRREISGYGVVTALDTVAQLDAEILTAQAAAAQSEAAAARAKSLATGAEAAVSREVVEAAQSKAATDQVALALARRKAEAMLGSGAPWRDATSRRAIMARLASGRTVLVRVVFPLGALGNSVPTDLQIARLDTDAKTWTATAVWNAPADPTLPGRGFYALVDGSDLAQNEHVNVFAPVGPAQAGFVVPASAIVYGESEAWIYVQTKPSHFVRTRIDISKPVGSNFFLPKGSEIAARQPVVTGGAGLLLAHELNPSAGAGD